MKITSLLRLPLLSLVVASLFVPMTPSASAATFTWDASGGAPLNDGAGTWNSSGGTNWFNGSTFGAWGNTTADTAVFGAANGAAGTISLGGTITGNSIVFNPPGSGSYTLSGGTISLGGTNPAITVQSGVSATSSSVFTGSAGIFKLGRGTLTLNNSSANTISGGGVNASFGTLVLDFSNMSTDMTPAAQPLNFSGGTIVIKGNPTGATSQTFAGNINMSSLASVSNITLNNNGGSGTTVVFNGTSGLNRIGGTVLNVDVSAGGTISTPSFPAGTQTVATFRDSTDIGFAAFTGAGGQMVRAATTPLLSNSNSTTDFITSGSLTMAGGSRALGSLILDGNAGSGSLDLVSGTTTLNRKAILLRGNNNYSISNGSLNSGSGSELIFHTMGTGTLTLNTPVLAASANQIIKNGPGTLSIPGANTHTGTTFLHQGTLAVGSNTSLGTGGVTVGGDSTLRTDSSVTLANNIAITGPVSGSRIGDRTLTVHTNGNQATASGVISGGGNLAKTGAGSLTLTNTNTYTGSTTVSGGKLIVNGAGSINGTSGISVGTNGTFVYSSSVSLTKAVTFQSSTSKLGGTSWSGTLSGLKVGTASGSNLQTISPGNSPGDANTANQTWADGGHYEFEINNVSGTPGTNWDHVTVTSALTLDSSLSTGTFTIDLVSLDGSNNPAALSGWNPNASSSWEIASYGSLAGLSFNSNLFTVDTSIFDDTNTINGTFSITNGSGSIILNYTAVPEPSPLVLWLIGITGLVLITRRSHGDRSQTRL